MSALSTLAIGFVGAVCGFFANAGLEMWLVTASSERDVFYRTAAAMVSEAKTVAEIDKSIRWTSDNIEYVQAPEVRLQMRYLVDSAKRVRKRFAAAETEEQQRKDSELRVKSESEAAKKEAARKAAADAAKKREIELKAAKVIQREFRRLPWFAY